MKIPKKLSHIWIGPLEPPLEWMQTWIDKHPDWEYRLYDNAFLAEHRFQTHMQIDEYMKRGMYAGVADLMRYEILYEFGGYMAGADSVCLHNIEELFDDDFSLYTIYENEMVRGRLVAPIVAATPKPPFLRLLIDELRSIEPVALLEPWKQTGNLFVAKMLEKHKPTIQIWPSYRLIPHHFTGVSYEGDEKVYADQRFGSTLNSYQTKNLLVRIQAKKRKRYKKVAMRKARELAFKSNKKSTRSK